MGIFFILLGILQVGVFFYFKVKVKKLEENVKENIIVLDLDKIKLTSDFSLDVWKKIYGDK